MFEKVRNRRSSNIDTLVGRNTRVEGDFSFTGGLHVDGDIRGNLTADGDPEAVLSISEFGKVEGDVHVPNVVLNGTVVGDVHASERVELAAAAKVTGDVYYNLIEMASGAAVNGKLVHRPKQDQVLALEHGGRGADSEGSEAPAVAATTDNKPEQATAKDAAGKAEADKPGSADAEATDSGARKTGTTRRNPS